MTRIMTSGWLQESYREDLTDWRAAIWSGLIAGAVFLVAELLMVALFMGESPWAPVRMIGAIAMGQDVLPPPATFDLTVFLAASAVHFALSVVYGLAFAWITHHMNGMNTLLIGALAGLLIYFVNFYLIAPAAFPWFMGARNWIGVVGHLIYGVVLGASYASLRRHKVPAQG